jgi:hypothetical protein
MKKGRPPKQEGALAEPRSPSGLFGLSWWWLLPVLLLVLPAVLVLVFLWTTPDFANFDYSLF